MIGELRNLPKNKNKNKMKIVNIGQKFFGFVLNCLKLDKKFWISFLLVVLIGVFLLPNKVISSPITREEIMKLSNKERVEAGFASLSLNRKLTEAALSKGKNILSTQAFEHNVGGKKFSAWVREAGYEYSYVGENLAIDFVTAEGVIKAWLNSEEHKRNLLNPNYQEIGVAVLEGDFEGQKTILVVQIFGSQLESLVPLEILKRDEQLGPGGEVLSANEYFSEAKGFKEKNYLERIFPNLDEKKSIFMIEILISIISILLALTLTYLYLLALISLIKFISRHKLE